jgi:hypothetical protein
MASTVLHLGDPTIKHDPWGRSRVLVELSIRDFPSQGDLSWMIAAVGFALALPSGSHQVSLVS